MMTLSSYPFHNLLVNVGHSLVIIPPGGLSVLVTLSTLLLPHCGGGLVSVQGLDCLLGQISNSTQSQCEK